MGKRALFELHVRMQVNLGRLRRFVAEPKSDHRQVDSASQQRHGRGVPKGVRRNGLRAQRRTCVTRRCGVLCDESLESIGTESSTA